MEDTLTMQRKAEKRVKEMQRQLQALAGCAPTFGEPPAPPKKEEHSPLPLLLLLWLLLDNGEHAALILLAYLLL